MALFETKLATKEQKGPLNGAPGGGHDLIPPGSATDRGNNVGFHGAVRDNGLI